MNLWLQITSEVGGVLCTSTFLIGERIYLNLNLCYNNPIHFYLFVLV